MKLDEISGQKKPFELTNLTGPIDPEVLKDILKHGRMYPTYYGSKLTVVMSNTTVKEFEYQHIERTYRENREAVIADMYNIYYNIKQKCIYSTVSFALKIGKRKDMYISYKIEKGNIVKPVTDAEVEAQEDDIDAFKLFSIVEGIDDL